ncbi:amidohydrolase [Haliscomenobacter sp.]|uniref:amidohydrolase n=1 Tax=Haliscomenobacter sp. TaxID=2717303 RepID=UPI003364D7A4
MTKTQFWGLCLCICTAQVSLTAQTAYDQIDKQATAINDKVVAWRRDLHQNPELSNREFKTAEKVAAHLKSLGLEVRTGVAKTGVIGILRTGKPGPVVGLRADMDALPVVERVKIPFASTAKSDYRGDQVGVMHACGHDTHVAMLMGAASILTGMKTQLAGTVVFIFQPAEEGPPPGETGGAKQMVEEGLLKDLKMNIVFGQHISSIIEVGNINIRPGGLMAAADRFVIKVKGKQTHGSQPWSGIDPVTISAQIALGLQTIVSRQMELTREAVVISIGKISGGVRNNIIPEEVELEGTIRTLDVDMQKDLHERMRRTAINIAEASGATAEVEIFSHVPITFNNPELFTKMGPTLKRVCGEDNVVISRAVTGAEDFAFFANEVPSMFYFVGGMPKGQDPKTAPAHHTPDFYVDESGMNLGVRLFCNLVLDYTTKLK